MTCTEQTCTEGSNLEAENLVPYQHHSRTEEISVHEMLQKIKIIR